MDYLVTRLYADGVRMQKRSQQLGTVRGTLSIVAEHSKDDRSSRPVLVARVHVGSDPRGIPHLREVQLLGTHGGAWVLGGYEELESGPMRKPCRLGQVWLVEPVAEDDLIRAEGKWADAARELGEARAKLKAAGLD